HRGPHARAREDPPRVRRALSLFIVPGNRQRRDDVRRARGRVSRSAPVLFARIARRMSSRLGEAHRSGAGARGRGDGPLTARLHDPEDRAHARHGMRPLKELMSFNEALRVAPGRCTVVATGSMLPKGADAVVMVEDTESEGGLVKVYSLVRPGENVSRRGEDIARKSLVVRTEEVLTPAKVGALAAIGRAR